ncbi:ArsR family transcriptional regulator [Paucilactobacillus oligofermentans DSM 15707 = LMG 22743]|uniref:ArsR family transcriptional regulator n=1 Tax=Paucilactobacillus oligofermentans DSM 15707 = LMG 22743 TaxID=1423778 RepID=A0A0R1RIX3_9LACO|nr:ArsR family transcriptional regulator [Paucilactobacillus oligofermentans]KRL54762.1 ArsR family transcriptional regulator [Paucilactobacillus oligofermentans DSM 15707 = LMG 22743]CUS26323.1 ArsR family transcriptional regulator [Paucilactobacillus oligofermentans DSM 15707 = LMG 22743]
MEISLNQDSIPIFSALDSSVRINIIELLSIDNLNISQIAKKINLSNAITVMHVNKLEKAGIISSQRKGNQRICILKIDIINIIFPHQIYYPFKKDSFEIPVGQFTNFDITPTCGLAKKDGFIGKVDNPNYFMVPERYQAQMIWFSDGFIEYQIPNYLESINELKMIEIVVELGSEFPFSNNNWLSDITVSIDNHEVGTWTSTGDFSDTRGRYTPKWVYNDMNQYGTLITFRISKYGTFINGKRSSDLLISEVNNLKNSWKLKFEVKKNAQNVGGCTIFGKGFGNHNQDISTTLYYD